MRNLRSVCIVTIAMLAANEGTNCHCKKEASQQHKEVAEKLLWVILQELNQRCWLGSNRFRIHCGKTAATTSHEEPKRGAPGWGKA